MLRKPRAARRPSPLFLLVLLPLAVGAFGGAAAGAPAVHDDLDSAHPGDGDTVRAVPAELRLLFTQPVNFDLATVTLEGPSRAVELGDVVAHPDSAALAIVPVEGRWEAGSHTVRWRIVGQDGHPVTGEYSFLVAEEAEGLAEGLAADVGEAGEGERARIDPGRSGESTAQGRATLDVGSPLFVAIRWLVFAGILGVVGAAWYRLVVLPLAARRSGSAPIADGPSGRGVDPAAFGMAAALLLLLAAGARLAAQSAAILPGGWDPGEVRTLLVATSWGWGWLVQAGAALAALVGFTLARRGVRAGWAVAALAAFAAGVSPALSGHSGGTGSALVIAADAGHVLGVGVWIGTLAVLLMAAVPAAVDARDPRRLAPLVNAFSLTALAAGAVVAVTGVAAAWVHLPSLSALWDSGYGRTLSLKLILLTGVFGTGAYNWLRVRPALEEGASATGLRRSAAVELSVAAVVLAVTAVLVATSPGS